MKPVIQWDISKDRAVNLELGRRGVAWRLYIPLPDHFEAFGRFRPHGATAFTQGASVAECFEEAAAAGLSMLPVLARHYQGKEDDAQAGFDYHRRKPVWDVPKIDRSSAQFLAWYDEHFADRVPLIGLQDGNEIDFLPLVQPKNMVGWFDVYIEGLQAVAENLRRSGLGVPLVAGGNRAFDSGNRPALNPYLARLLSSGALSLPVPLELDFHANSLNDFQVSESYMRLDEILGNVPGVSIACYEDGEANDERAKRLRDLGAVGHGGFYGWWTKWWDPRGRDNNDTSRLGVEGPFGINVSTKQRFDRWLDVLDPDVTPAPVPPPEPEPVTPESLAAAHYASRILLTGGQRLVSATEGLVIPHKIGGRDGLRRKLLANAKAIEAFLEGE